MFFDMNLILFVLCLFIYMFIFICSLFFRVNLTEKIHCVARKWNMKHSHCLTLSRVPGATIFVVSER